MALSFGELLAGAGRIGSTAAAEANQMRQYERDRMALEELRRNQQARQEIAAGAGAAFAPAQMPTLPQFQFADLGVENLPTAPTPAAPTPAPSVEGFSQLDPNSPQARALYQQRLERLRTEQSKAAGVPLTVPGAPSKAGVTPAAGVMQVDPQGSQFKQWYQRSTAQGQVGAQLDSIQRSLVTGEYGGPGSAPIRRAYGFFADDPATVKQREKATVAADWYGSAAADTYFQQNPNLLAEAKKDPVGFYEKVAKGEKGLKTAMEPQPMPATKKAQKYDSTQTEYDALMMQSAQQYGIDPVIFKRLIGSESSFQPDPTANRKIARGIAQIHVNNIKAGMISLQDSLNPQVAIPFAAQLLSRYLQESGGNYEQALQKYKGAVSVQGKRSMAGIINDILSGTQPMPTAPVSTAAAPTQVGIGTGAVTLPGRPEAQPQIQTLPGRPEDLQVQPRMYARQDTIPNPFISSAQAAPAPAAPAAAPARTVQPEASFYMANPQAITADMQAATQARQFAVNQRNELARMAEIYMRSGTEAGIQNAMNMRSTIMQMDAQLLESSNQMMYLQGMQGLQEFQLANDPRRLGAVWSQYAGVPVGIQPRSDGTFNIIVNGKKTKEGVSASDISDAARSAFDGSYRQQKAETAKGMSIKSFEKQLDAQVEAVKQNAQMIREATVEAIKGRNKAMEIRLGREDFDIKPMGDGTARAWVYNKAGTALGVMDASTGQFIEMDGIKVPKGPTYTGVKGAPAGVSGNVR